MGVIKAVSKLFHKDGVGTPLELKAFLKEKNVSSKLIYPFKGNRFHILFKDAEGLFYLQPFIIDFLSNIWGTPNQLHKAILHDLQCRTYIIGCRALGIIGKYITGPWMRLTETNVPILELNSHFEDALSRLNEWISDPSSFFRDDCPSIFNGISVNKDNVYKCLIKASSLDTKTKLLLGLLLSKIKEVFVKQLSDQITGGIHSNPQDDLQLQSASCGCNNISCERIFGMLDSHIQRAPVATLVHNESKILFKSNKTGEWLREKDDNSKQDIIAAARKRVKVHDQNLKERLLSVQKHIVDKLREKQAQLQSKSDFSRQKKENLLEDLMTSGGLWVSETQMDQELYKLKSPSQKKLAVKTQINVRKSILDQDKSFSSHYFHFSNKGKQFSLDILKANLLYLIQNSMKYPDLNSEIKKVLDNPKELNGKFISHKWNNDEGSSTWYEGQIQSPDAHLEFKIVYVNDNEPIFMTLDEIVADMKSGDMVVLWEQN